MKTLLLNFILSLSICWSMAAGAKTIKIITNEKTPYNEISRETLRDYFLKKNKHWPNGTPIRFFDRLDESPERKIFLREIVGRSQREVETHWISQKFSTGQSAPTQIPSDSTISSLVARFPGSLGYVSGDFITGPGVKVLEVK